MLEFNQPTNQLPPIKSVCIAHMPAVPTVLCECGERGAYKTGPWRRFPEQPAPVTTRATLRTTGCAGIRASVNAIGTQLIFT